MERVLYTMPSSIIFLSERVGRCNLRVVLSVSKNVKHWVNKYRAVLMGRAQKPVKGVMVPLERAAKIADGIICDILDRGSELSNDPDIMAEALGQVSQFTKEQVAEERTLSQDQQRYHDASEARYEKNLHLGNLKRKNSQGVYDHEEWSKLMVFLKPFSLGVFRGYSLAMEDREEVFNDVLVSFSIPKEKDSGGLQEIERLTVFEELLPNFLRALKFRTIDFLRKRSRKKSSPSAIQSLDDDESGALAKDMSSDVQHMGGLNLTFEEIYKQCKELLTKQEWKLIYHLYVSQEVTVKKLAHSNKLLREYGIETDGSHSTRRRRIENIVKPALLKIHDEFIG